MGVIETSERVASGPSPAMGGVHRVRRANWPRALMGAGMVVALVVCFVPAILLYTLLFGVDAMMRLFDFSANRAGETP